MNIKGCFVQLTSTLALLFAYWSVVWCLIGYLEPIHTSSSGLGSTRPWVLGYPWSSKFLNTLSNKLLKILVFFVPFAKYSPSKLVRWLSGSSLCSPNFCESETDCFFCGFVSFGGRIEYPWTFASLKTHNAFLTSISGDWFFVKCKTYCSKNWLSRKWKAERVLSKGKRVVLSRDQAHIHLVLVQACASSLVFCHYVSALVQQSHVLLHVC